MPARSRIRRTHRGVAWWSVNGVFYQLQRACFSAKEAGNPSVGRLRAGFVLKTLKIALKSWNWAVEISQIRRLKCHEVQPLQPNPLTGCRLHVSLLEPAALAPEAEMVGAGQLTDGAAAVRTCGNDL